MDPDDSRPLRPCLPLIEPPPLLCFLPDPFSMLLQLCSSLSTPPPTTHFFDWQA